MRYILHPIRTLEVARRGRDGWQVVRSYLSELSMRERWALVLKFCVLVIAVGFVAAGRPPMIGQVMRQPPKDPTPHVQAVEDALQDRDIANLQMDARANADLSQKNAAAIVVIATDVARLDTKITCFAAFVAVLQASGMILSFKRKTAS